MSKELDSIRAAAAEAAETVVLTKEFYSCIVKDPRTKSGQHQAVRLPSTLPLPAIPMVTPKPSARPVEAMRAPVSAMLKTK